MRAIRRSAKERFVNSSWYQAICYFAPDAIPEWRLNNLFNEILLAYHEPQRRYHNFDHIVYGIGVIKDSVFSTGTSLNSPEAIILAYVYHDVVYIPGARDNEERSADFMRRHLRSLSVPEDFIRRIARYIMCTKHNGKPIREIDARIVVDVDLAQLGASFERFKTNTVNIAFEYAKVGVTAEQYAVGRKKFFESMLARPQIYQTPQFREKLERKARWNLNRAIKLAA